MGKKKKTLEQAVTILNGCDEYERIARVNLGDYFEASGRGSADPAAALEAFEMGLDDAAESWALEPEGSPERRAALLRLMASVAAVLVADELVRGSKACERIYNRLDRFGYLREEQAGSSGKTEKS